MKIAFVITGIGGGGAERVATLLMNEWSTDHDVCFFLTSVPHHKPYSVKEQVKIKYISYKKINVFKKIRLLKKEIIKFNPDVIVSFLDVPNFYAAIVGKSIRIPTIMSRRNHPKAKSNLIISILNKISLRNSNKVVLQSEYIKALYNKNIQKKAVVIPNPINEKKASTISQKRDGNTIIAVGRLAAQKDYETMINAMNIFSKRNMNYVLEINGDGPLKLSLVKKTEELKLTNIVKFNNFNTKVDEAFETAKIYLMTSKFEGMPNAFFEAKMNCLPAVVTEGSVEAIQTSVIKDKSNVIVPTGNPVAIAHALNKVISNYAFYSEEAKKTAKIYFEDYALAKISKCWINLFKEVISSNK